MSNYKALAYHPRTEALEEATFLDDYYGKHQYAVRFMDGTTVPIAHVKVPAAIVSIADTSK